MARTTGNEPTVDQPARTSQTGPGTAGFGLGKDLNAKEKAEGFHDSQSGRAVDEQGNFVDGQGDGQIPKHRIVANNWPEIRD